MQRTLFLLTVMGQVFISSCRLYEYHFINKDKTWDEAQEYCRKKYSDLATVTDEADTQQLKEMIGKENVEEAWIGLQSHKWEDNRTWHWSLPGVESNETKFEKHWEEKEPNDANGRVNENCVRIKGSNHKWQDDHCENSRAFICYNGTDPVNGSYYEIDDEKTWLKAQSYCRKNHTDLLSGLGQLNQFYRSNESVKSEYVWIGLFRDTWRWSDKSNFSFRNWGLDVFNDGTENNKCATVTKTSGEWRSDSCQNEKPFFCYDDKVVLVNQKMNWEDALYYCQEKHDDLVTITDADDQRWVQTKAKNATTPHVWLGLRYTCTLDFWFWVSDAVVRYKNWGRGQEENGCDMSGAMSRKWAHKWVKKSDELRLNFICSKL